MKRLSYILTILVSICFLSSCEEEVLYPTFDAPGWNVVDNADYSVTMTVVAEIPEYIAKNAQSGDELAAFAGNECRGVAKKVGELYYIMIDGTDDENPPLQFRFYSAANRYMYQTTGTYQFKANAMIGTVDEPEKLFLEIIKD